MRDQLSPAEFPQTHRRFEAKGEPFRFVRRLCRRRIAAFQRRLFFRNLSEVRAEKIALFLLRENGIARGAHPQRGRCRGSKTVRKIGVYPTP